MNKPVTPMKTYRFWLRLFGVAVLALSIVAVFFASNFASRWTYAILHPSGKPATGEFLIARNIPFEEITLTTKDGVKLAAWYTPPQNNAVILIAHGYNDNRPESLYAMFVERGYGVVAWDARAHGDSEGDMTTFGYYEQLDVKSALDFALAQTGVEHVGAWGGSMGAATVILTAAEQPQIEAVVADSAYPTLKDVLRFNMPIQFLQPFVLFYGEYHSGVDFDDVNPAVVISKISPRPVFIIDGWEGGAIAMNSPYRLFDAAQEPKQIWVEDGVPHLGMYAHNPKRYENKVIGFFDMYLLNK